MAKIAGFADAGLRRKNTAGARPRRHPGVPGQPPAGFRGCRVKSTARTAILLPLLLAASAASGQVTPERLQNASREPQNWLTYSGDYSGRRFSSLDQISRSNA